MQTEKIFNKIITGDDTWCFAYGPETKRQTSAWIGKTSPRSKKLKFRRSRVKIMLIIFFDSQSAVHKEFVQEGKTVNVEFYEGKSISKLQILIEKKRMGRMTYKQHLFFNVISKQI